MHNFQTEFDFVLPRGYVDKNGRVYKNGKMRLSTAADEILPLKDPRVQANPAYLVIILLSRVITSLEDMEGINPRIVEEMFASDLAYLQELYNRINGSGTTIIKVVCPHCQKGFEVEPEAVGE